MRIVIWNSKGGAGKTTLAAAIASELHARGETVLGVDLDSQRSLAGWGALTSDVDVAAADMSTVSRIFSGDLPYQHMVIDTPGRETEIARVALSLADLVVVPIGSTPVDFAAVKASLPVLEAVSAKRPGLPIRFLRNRYDARRRFARQAEDVLALMGHKCAETTIGYRVDYESLLAGVPLPEGSKSRNEIHRLVTEMESFHARDPIAA